MVLTVYYSGCMGYFLTYYTYVHPQYTELLTYIANYKFTRVTCDNTCSTISWHTESVKFDGHGYNTHTGWAKKTAHKLQWSSVGALRCYRLSWPTTVQFITLLASTFAELSWLDVSTIGMPWRNFLNPEFQRELSLLHTKLMAIILSNLNRISKLFHWEIL